MVVTFTKMIGIQGNCLYFLWAQIRLHKKSEFEGSFRYSTKQTAAGKQPPPVKWVTAGPFSPIVLLHCYPTNLQCTCSLLPRLWRKRKRNRSLCQCSPLAARRQESSLNCLCLAAVSEQKRQWGWSRWGHIPVLQRNHVLGTIPPGRKCRRAIWGDHIKTLTAYILQRRAEWSRCLPVNNVNVIFSRELHHLTCTPLPQHWQAGFPRERHFSTGRCGKETLSFMQS